MQSASNLTAPDAHACASSGETRADRPSHSNVDDFWDAVAGCRLAVVAYAGARETRERRAAFARLRAWVKRASAAQGGEFVPGKVFAMLKVELPLLAAAAPAAVVLTAAALALILLGAPLPAAIALGTSAEVPPVLALGVPASFVALLVAAGPIRAS